MNDIVIQFANGGFILEINVDGDTKTSVFVSQGKLMKAVKGAVDTLSLLPKKADDSEE